MKEEVVIEENLIEDYNAGDFIDEKLQQKYINECTKTIEFSDKSKLEYTYYDDTYMLTSPDNALYVRKDMYDSLGQLLTSDVSKINEIKNNNLSSGKI